MIIMIMITLIILTTIAATTIYCYYQTIKGEIWNRFNLISEEVQIF